MLSHQAYGLLAVFATMVNAVDVTKNPGLDAQLKTAATALDRLALLSSDSDWVFDFNPASTFQPGSVVNANAATFPATVGNGMTMATLNLGPCAILPPHFHPRASNYVVAIAGTTNTYMIQENGARTVQTTLTPGKMTIFPAASVHSMANTGCTNSVLISALNSDDTGTHNIANALFSLPVGSILSPALGYVDIDYNATAGSIPRVGTGSIAGDKACLARCAGKNQNSQ